MANALTTYFYKRVGVAVLDLAFPSNLATFGELFPDALPALLIKRPEKIQKMFVLSQQEEDMSHISHDELHKWGEVISHADLGKVAFLAK